MIQGGDPLGTGTGGPGYTVDEPPPAEPRVHARARSRWRRRAAEPPGRSGSQFFVVTGADAGLPPEYALLGKVSKGIDVVERIGELGDPASGRPGTPWSTVVIRRITVGEG